MRKFKVSVNGVEYQVEVEEEGAVISKVAPPPANLPATPIPAPPEATGKSTVAVAVASGNTSVIAPMPGKIVQVFAKLGEIVKKGDALIVLEAMKMQNEITVPVGGVISSVNVSPGQAVKVGEVMVSIC